MFISSGWQSKTALVMALGMTSLAAVPALMAAPATASVKPYLVGQLLSQSERVAIPAGTVIPVELEKAQKIVVTPDETAPVTLLVAKSLTLRNSNQRLPMRATSKVITERETIKKGTDVGQILKGAAIGAAASTVLAEIFGDIDFKEVLGGAGLGAIAGLLLGGRKQAEVIVVNPEEDLSLTLQSDLVL